MRISDWSSDVCSSDLVTNHYTTARSHCVDADVAMTSTLVLGVKSCLPRSPGFPRRTRRLIVVRLLQCLQNALDARGDFPGRDSFRTFVILHGRSHSAGMARTDRKSTRLNSSH